MIFAFQQVTEESITPVLKPGEKILCSDAIITIDERGEISWWDKNTLIPIVYADKKEEDNNANT